MFTKFLVKKKNRYQRGSLKLENCNSNNIEQNDLNTEIKLF